MTTLFISDLHLDSAFPELTALFRHFMQTEATKAEHLYILGDLFEVWVGDDHNNKDYTNIAGDIHQLVDKGVPVSIMHGNRDFLLGNKFIKESGCKLVAEPAIIDLYGTPTLLLHGDSLCTDDIEHQKFRAESRSKLKQKVFLSLPLGTRCEIASKARKLSNSAKRLKSDDIMDVNTSAVEDIMREHGVRHLIHGHTHRPAIHDLDIDGEKAQRIVLGDWQESFGSVLYCDENGCRLELFEG